MEIHLDKRAVRQIRLSAQEAIEEDDTESLREDILEAFTEDQVEEIERRLDNGDFFEFLDGEELPAIRRMIAGAVLLAVRALHIVRIEPVEDVVHHAVA